MRSRSSGKVGRCIFWHAVLASPLMTSLRRISQNEPSPPYPSIRPFCSQRQRCVIISCNIRKEIVRSDFTAKSRRLFTPRGSFVINVESGEHYAALMQPELRDKHIKCSLTYTTTLVSTLIWAYMPFTKCILFISREKTSGKLLPAYARSLFHQKFL